MRPGLVLLLAATVVALAGSGLVAVALREGPIDATLDPVRVAATAEGSYESRAGGAVLGVCPTPPCSPRTAIDIRFQGLPDVPYTARLDGASRAELGALQREGDGHVLRWEEAEDHTDKDRIVLVLAGRDVTALFVQPGTAFQVAGSMSMLWATAPARVHLNEIGAFTVSTVALAELDEEAPEGWEYRARLEGRDGAIDLGAFSGTALDARVERVRLEDQDRFVVSLHPAGADPESLGFPVLAAAL